nr:hypothetical protein [Tanacetum cinerariifolium]
MLGNSRKSSFSSNWNDIVRDISLLYSKGINLLVSIKKKIGNGENTMFWEESWKGDVPLKSLYPRIYALESNKNISVATKISNPSISSSLKRNPRGGVEQVYLVDLLSSLEGLILPNMLDRWSWSLTGSEEFSISSARNYIDDRTLKAIDSKTCWIKAVLIKSGGVGSLLFVYRPRLRRFWKEFSTLLGGRMVSLTVTFYHDEVFIGPSLEYVEGNKDVMKDLDFEYMTYGKDKDESCMSCHDVMLMRWFKDEKYEDDDD